MEKENLFNLNLLKEGNQQNLNTQKLQTQKQSIVRHQSLKNSLIMFQSNICNHPSNKTIKRTSILLEQYTNQNKCNTFKLNQSEIYDKQNIQSIGNILTFSKTPKIINQRNSNNLMPNFLKKRMENKSNLNSCQNISTQQSIITSSKSANLSICQQNLNKIDLFKKPNSFSQSLNQNCEQYSKKRDEDPQKQKNQNTRKICMNDFDLGQMLGKGAFGKVRVVRHKSTGSFYALKTYQLNNVKEKLDKFIETIKLQMYSTHPNIAQVYALFTQEKQVHLLMELCIDGDLSYLIKHLKKNKKQAKQVLKGIARGLQFLCDRQILHRDIKLENILLCYNMPKITDFDLSVYQKNPLECRRTFCGSPAYFSPQMISNYCYNNKADVWSFGILCYEIICGYFPFNMKQYHQIQNIVNQPLKQYPSELTDEEKNIIQITLVKEPDQRASWKDIIHHPYFKN